MKTALITGASGGTGEAFARLFAKDHINLVLVARSGEKLKKLALELEQQYHIKATVLIQDLSFMEQVETVFKELTNLGIHVDYLINNAGFGDYAYFNETAWLKQEEMINLNIQALTRLTHLFLPGMIKNGYGKILNMASTAAFQPGPGMSVYFASKAYVLHFSEAIAYELKGTGVTVTACCPGAFESGFQLASSMEESKLVKGKKLPSAASIAFFGYRHMMKGTTVCIPGLMNYMLANAVRFSPRNLVVWIAGKMQEKAK